MTKVGSSAARRLFSFGTISTSASASKPWLALASLLLRSRYPGKVRKEIENHSHLQ
jgi:hypothetical protein